MNLLSVSMVGRHGCPPTLPGAQGRWWPVDERTTTPSNPKRQNDSSLGDGENGGNCWGLMGVSGGSSGWWWLVMVVNGCGQWWLMVVNWWLISWWIMVHDCQWQVLWLLMSMNHWWLLVDNHSHDQIMIEKQPFPMIKSCWLLMITIPCSSHDG